MSRFKDIVAATSGVQLDPVVNSAELQRILRLPRRKLTPDPELMEAMTNYFRVPGGTMELRWIQVAALYEAAVCNGLFGPIGVGHGKTLITLLMATAMDSRCTVLLLPAQLKKKTLREIDEVYAKHFKIPLARLRIHSYEELSRAATADLLDEHKPDLIVLDEAHKLKRPQSARTKRFLRYMQDNPGCRLVALSGTMTQRRLIEYAHLCELALGKGSPLPGSYREVVDWGGALDVEPPEPKRPGALKKLCADGESAREGFRRRLVETPGVIATEDEGFDGTIVMKATKLKLPDDVKAAREQLRETWEIGSEVVTEATHFARVMKQLACGFFYRWDWGPDGPDEKWLETRREWGRALRYFLRYRSRAGLDSPALVERALKRGEVSGDIVDVWTAWQKVKDRPEPETVPVWINDFMIRAAEKWADKNPKGIIWYEHRAFEDAFRERGWPVYASGDDASTATEPVIVCSIKAQGTGKNMQAFHRNLILSMPSNGSTLEQLIGRTHRPGQLEDEVFLDWYAHTPEMVNACEKAIADAEYMQESMGQRQKLLLAEVV